VSAVANNKHKQNIEQNVNDNDAMPGNINKTLQQVQIIDWFFDVQNGKVHMLLYAVSFDDLIHCLSFVQTNTLTCE
jgi:hypothetical protein